MLGWGPLNLTELGWLLPPNGPAPVPVLDSLSSKAHDLNQIHSCSAFLAQALLGFTLTLTIIGPSCVQSVRHAEPLEVLGGSL